MEKFHPRRFGSTKSDSDADRAPHRTGLKKKPSSSLEILLLGLLSACIGFLLFLVFFRS